MFIDISFGVFTKHIDETYWSQYHDQNLKNKYWIFSVMTLAKKVCKQGIHCQRQDYRPQDQGTAPLPSDRVTQEPPS